MKKLLLFLICLTSLNSLAQVFKYEDESKLIVKVVDNKKEGTYQVTIDHSTINNIFNTSEIEDINNYSLTNLKTMGLELNLNIKMPGNISETSYGKIQDNQVKINLLDFLTQDETKSISIISSNRHQTTQPANIFIFVALIIILYIILRKRR